MLRGRPGLELTCAREAKDEENWYLTYVKHGRFCLMISGGHAFLLTCERDATTSEENK